MISYYVIEYGCMVIKLYIWLIIISVFILAFNCTGHKKSGIAIYVANYKNSPDMFLSGVLCFHEIYLKLCIFVGHATLFKNNTGEFEKALRHIDSICEKTAILTKNDKRLLSQQKMINKCMQSHFSKFKRAGRFFVYRYPHAFLFTN